MKVDKKPHLNLKLNQVKSKDKLEGDQKNKLEFTKKISNLHIPTSPTEMSKKSNFDFVLSGSTSMKNLANFSGLTADSTSTLLQSKSPTANSGIKKVVKR